MEKVVSSMLKKKNEKVVSHRENLSIDTRNITGNQAKPLD